MLNEHIETYIKELNRQFQTGNAREHSYRPALKNLVENILSKGFTFINEPKHIACGAPDFMLIDKDLPKAFAEAKDITDTDLDGLNKNKEQFDRYKKSLNSIFFSNYLSFHFYEGTEQKQKITLAQISGNEIVPVKDIDIQEDIFIKTLLQWASATPQLITTPKKLAERMAMKAQLLARTIAQALLEDKQTQQTDSPLWLQLNSFKNALLSDIDEHKFADLYAQTIAYGLFAARLNDSTPNTFSRQKAATLIPPTNPFLRSAFQHIAGYDIDTRIAWIIDDIAEMFLATNMQKVMHNFKQETAQHDPILHFYEDFLQAYDPKQKKATGVYYTPEPVVDFIVRAVDEVLKKDFHLPNGLADTSMVKSGLHRVQILDPATGTGTFLSNVIRKIKEDMQGKMGAWNSYVQDHLLPRIYGFELMMAPYTIAHLKVGMEIDNDNSGMSSTKHRLKIYMTNSLEQKEIRESSELGSIIAKESNEATEIKHNAPIMIVMGNPPYSVSSNNKSEWITKLVEDYKQHLNEKNIQPLSDDYIKFIRLAQYYVEKNGEGIVAYISNNSFIDGLIHRQMRNELMRVFDKIYILDLHGNTRKKETAPDGGKDENVFDIMQGVSINIFVKLPKK